MKRHVASRKLKRKCIYCNKSFVKGDVYYRERNVYDDEGNVTANEWLICPMCKYKKDDSAKRFKKFATTCTHPDKFIQTKYSYIPGEAVMEPDYSYCGLCNAILI